MDARTWLRANGYADIADLIDGLMLRWKEAQKKTRRNWWEVLAGNKKGESCVVDGVKFPVLRAAQLRQGLKTVKGAKHKKKETPAPPIVPQARWGH